MLGHRRGTQGQISQLATKLSQRAARQSNFGWARARIYSPCGGDVARKDRRQDARNGRALGPDTVSSLDRNHLIGMLDPTAKIFL